MTLWTFLWNIYISNVKMPLEKSHSDFCERLCLLCLGKGPILRPIKSKVCYSSKYDYIKYIKCSWWPAYDPGNEKLPRVLFMNCRVKLVKSNDTSNPKPLPSPTFKPNTRFNLKCGDCEICLHGRFMWNELGGHTAFSVLPTSSNPKVDKRRKGPLSPQKESRCKTCLQVIGRGIGHQCNRTNKPDNLSEIVYDLNWTFYSLRSTSIILKVLNGTTVFPWTAFRCIQNLSKVIFFYPFYLPQFIFFEIIICLAGIQYTWS